MPHTDHSPTLPESADRPMTIGQCASLACLLEVAAPKPGNVHRGADFAEMGLVDFLVSATAIGPVMQRAREVGIGRTVLSAVEATRQLAGTNTNLGTVLLLAPLAAVPPTMSLDEGIAMVLEQLTHQDCHLVYQAIALARPGGLGQVDQMDVHRTPPDDLIDAMRAAAGRALVARQYTNQFSTVRHEIQAWLLDFLAEGTPLLPAIVHTHVRLMSEFPDSLIARKCGTGVARQAADRARRVIESGPAGQEPYQRALEDLDFWLRSDHHRRNPGTSADLIAATLFVALRDRRMTFPLQLRD